MKFAAIVVLFAVVSYVTSTPCHHLKCLSPPPKVCFTQAPSLPPPYLPGTCFNAKHAFFGRHPLLYKIYMRRAERVAKKLDGVVPCAPLPAVLPLAHPAPASLAPELLNTLLAYSAARAPPALPCV